MAEAPRQKTLPFSFIDLDGRAVRLADFRGQWVLVNFWAAWCPLCWVEVPALNALNRRPDFVVIGVSLDYGQDETVIRDAISAHNLDFHAHVAGGARRDPKSPFRQVGPVDFFPTSYLYAPDGEVVMYIPGQLKQDKVLAFMRDWSGGRGSAEPAYAFDAKRLEAVLAGRFGAAGRAAWRDWRAMLGQAAGSDERGKLERVNEFFNRRLVQSDDARIWKQPDYWATLAETLGVGKGDSEDFVIAKYFTLLALNVPADRLRLVTVRQRGAPADDPVHMVLAYYPTPGGEPLLLDNRQPAIQPALARTDLKPVFSFNSQDVWGDASGVLGQPAASAKRLPAWQDTLRRARAEGFE